ncbi:MAG: hypothetical protein ACYDD7_23145, partial [Acidimicrobiales bacterium]
MRTRRSASRLACAVALTAASVQVLGPKAASAATSVGQAQVSLTSTAAYAQQASYTYDFTVTTAMARATSSVTIAGPIGTIFPPAGDDYSGIDHSGNQTLSFGSPVRSSDGGTVTVRLANDVAAGDSLTLNVAGVTNPGPGTVSSLVSTSADTQPAPSVSYTINPASSVSHLTASASTGTAGLAATYTVALTLSAEGAIEGLRGTVTLAASPGTTLPSGAEAYSVVDESHPTRSGVSADRVKIAASGETASVTFKSTFVAGDQLVITVYQVHNPPSGLGPLTLLTSSDTVPATVTPTAGGGAVGSVTARLSNDSAGVPTQLTLQFTTPSPLAIDVSTVTLRAPPGTVFPANGFTIADTTGPTPVNVSTGVVVTGGGTEAALSPRDLVPAGDTLAITVTGMRNPPPGSHQLQVWTSADSVAVSVSFDTTAPRPIGTPQFLVANPAATATSRYTLSFTTTHGLLAGLDDITLAAPVGTLFTTDELVLFDTTASPAKQIAIPCCASVASDGAMMTVPIGTNVPAGDALTLTVGRARNPAAGSYQLAAWTSADPVQSSVAYTISGIGAVGSVQLMLSNSAASGTSDYTIGFSATHGLAPHIDDVTVSAPAGSRLPSDGGRYQLTDTSTSPATPIGLECCLTLIANATTATVLIASVGAPAGHVLSLGIAGVTNPSAGATQLAIRTSADPMPSTVGFTIGPVGAVGPPAVSLASSSSGTTYTVSFTATHGIDARVGQVTVAAPPGTLLPTDTGKYRLTDTTASPAQVIGIACCVAVAVNGTTVSIPITTPGVPGGHALTLTVMGVTDPAAGSHTLRVSTSADRLPTASNSYNTSGSGPSGTAVGTPTLTLGTPSGDASAVAYTARFVATNGLTPSTAVNFAAAAGTIWPSDGRFYAIRDVTANTQPVTSCCSSPVVVADGSSVSFPSGAAIPAGHQVQVVVREVSSPPAGNDTLAVTTATDTAPATAAYTVNAASAVGSPTVTVSAPGGGATAVAYTLRFVATTALGTDARISLSGSPGTVWSADGRDY